MRRRLSVTPITLALVLLIFIIGGASQSIYSLADMGNLKIEKALLQLSEIAAHERLLWAQNHGVAYEAGRPAVDAIVEPRQGISPRVLSQSLKASGVDVQSISNFALRARIDVGKLKTISGIAEVGYIRRSLSFHPLRITPLERGVLKTGGSLMHAHRWKGNGVTIAIIDSGFQGLSEAIARGEFAEGSILDAIDYTEDGLEADSDHGLEVTRVAYQMAPESTFVLMNIGDDVDLENAVADAIAMGVDVINHSVGWFDSNFGDGEGRINEMVREANAAGIVWVNAAGNQAGSHWMGPNTDLDEDGWIEFAPDLETLEIFMQFPGQIDLILVWDEFPVGRQDFDLYLTDWEENVLESSEETQSGTASPAEKLTFFAESPGLYKVKVKATRANNPVRLKVFVLEQNLSPAVPEGSIVAPADCTCTIAVGAVNLTQWELGFIEFFSARGPTSDGRIKPDIVAPDGMNGLNGTSFSSPYVAGAVALIKSRYPQWGVEQIMSELSHQAFDIYAPGKDNISGFGKMEMRLENAKAMRSFSSDAIEPGGAVEVSITAQMPSLQFGRFEIEERIPSIFDVEVVDASGGNVTLDTVGNQIILRWVKELLGPRESIELTYRATLNADHRQNTDIEFTGAFNNDEIGGDRTLRVGRTTSGFSNSRQPLIVPYVGATSVRFHLARNVLKKASGMQVQIFDMSGESISDSGWVSPHRPVLFSNAKWSSGVYIYLVSLKDHSGRVISRSVKKFHVLKSGNQRDNFDFRVN